MIETPLFALMITLVVYLAASQLYSSVRSFLLHPVLVTIAVLIGILTLLRVDYEIYFRGAWPVHFLLGPAVVALGLPLYDQLRLLRKEMPAILVSTAFGSIVGVVSVTVPLVLMKVPHEITASLAPKSVTTPIAIVLSEGMGGEPSLTASVVVVTGILGAVLGPVLLRVFGLVNGIPFGLAMGASSHGIGTARAVEKGSLEGASSGLALCLNGLFTSICAPPVVNFMAELSGFGG